MRAVQRLEPESLEGLRTWMESRHATDSAVWLVLDKKSSGRQRLSLSEAIDEALCWGWIDSKSQGVDEDRYEVYFSVRKPGGTWSRINKDKVEVLLASGRMQPAGMGAIEQAKIDGSWTILDGPEAGIVPDDLAAALAEAQVRQAFDALSEGRRKNTLAWIAVAKRDATRQTRITRTVEAAGQGRSPLD